MKFSQKLDTRQIWFGLATVLAFMPFVNPAIALVLGMLLSFGVGSPADVFGKNAKKWGSQLLRIAVVGLGFGVNLGVLIQTGRDAFFSTSLFVVGTLVLGLFVGRILGGGRLTNWLIAAGTAICGGSAIATIGSVLKADNNELSISTAVIFLLNAVALVIFPTLGTYFGLSEQQFGHWAAIAIHDTSSVVGAAAKFGETSLYVATTLKMVRVLWIIPIAFFLLRQQKRRDTGGGQNAIDFPYFIVGFLVASCLFSLANEYNVGVQICKTLNLIAKQLMIVSLVWIGAGVSWAAMRSAGIKIFLHAAILWVIVSLTAFFFVKMYV